MPDTDWDMREREMAPEWSRLARRRPRDPSTYSWPASIVLVAAAVLLLLAAGFVAGWYA